MTLQWNSPGDERGAFDPNNSYVSTYNGNIWVPSATGAAICGGDTCQQTGLGITTFNQAFGVGSGGTMNCPAIQAICPSLVRVYLDASGNGILPANALAQGQSRTYCLGPVTETSPLTNFDCSHLGFQPVLLTVTGTGGVMASVNCDVEIVDTIPPTILTCPADTVITIMTGDCATEFELTLPTIDDNCGAEVFAKVNNAAPFPALFIGEHKTGLNGTLSEVYGDGTSSLIKNIGGSAGLVMDSDTSIIVAVSGPLPVKLMRINLLDNTCDTLATHETLPAWIEGIDVDGAGNVVVAGTLSGKIYQVNISTKVVTELVTGLSNPADVVYENPNSLLITEFFAGQLIRYDLNTNTLTVLTSGFVKPIDILQLNNGKFLVSEASGFVSEIDSISGAKTVISPDLSGTKLLGLALGNNNNLYIALEFEHRILEMDLTTGDTSTFASGLDRPRFIVTSPGNTLAPNVHTLVWEAVDTSGNKDECYQQVTINSTTCPNDAEVLDFDGVDDYVDLGVWNPHSAAGFTHEAWVYADTLGPDDWSNSVIMQEGPSGTSTILRCGENGSHNVRASFHHSGGLYDLNGTIATDTWQHLAMTWDPIVDTFYLYVNGVLADKMYAPNPPNTVSGNVWIGNAEIAPDRWWNGRMDEVRIWDHYRTQSQILTYMLCGLHGTEAGLLAYYNFNQGNAFQNNLTVNTLIDLTGNHIGSLQNFDLVAADSSNWVEPGPLLGTPKSNGFITTWEATLSDKQITIPTFGSYSYNYTVDWGDGIKESGLTGNATHVYASPGTYTVSIDGVFPAFFLNNTGDRLQLKSIEQWGDIQWATFHKAFFGADKMLLNATDAPDLSNVTDMSWMFARANLIAGSFNHWDISNVISISLMYAGTTFNGDVSGWNTSNVTLMQGTFSGTPFNGSVANWDVTNVTDMRDMFTKCTAFNQPLSNWERVGSTLANVTDMINMFNGATAFNQNIDNWDVSSVRNFRAMFQGATDFNQPLNSWNVGSAVEIAGMFASAASFDQPLNNWNVSNLGSIYQTFAGASSFNQDLSSWDVSKVSDMGLTFIGATSFNQSLGNWDITNVTRMVAMFDSSGVDLTNYDATLIGWATQTPKIGLQVGGAGMTYCASLLDRQQLMDDFGWTFNGDAQDPTCILGGPAEALCFDGVDDYVEMPANLTATYDDFTFMAWHYYKGADEWERIFDFGTSSAVTMYLTPKADTGTPQFIITDGIDYHFMFSPDSLLPETWYHLAVTVNGTTNTGTLYVNGVQKAQKTPMLSPSDLGNTTNNWLGRSEYPSDPYLNGRLDEVSIWNVALSQSQVQAYMNNALTGTEGGLQHYYQFNQGTASDNNAGEDTLEDELGTGNGMLHNFALNGACSNWVLPGSGIGLPDAFVTTWETTTANDSITIPTRNGLVYDYNVDWGDGTVESGNTGDATHIYDTAGVYTVSIWGTFPRLNINNAYTPPGTVPNKHKLKSIEAWGGIQWEDLKSAFAGCKNMAYNALDAPDLSAVTDLSKMFYGCKSFTSGSLSNWDMSTITKIDNMFEHSAFDGDVNGWNTSGIISMKSVFSYTPFNGSLDNWDVSNVKNMRSMFKTALQFDQDISGWDMSNVTRMSEMFNFAKSFNQDISGWDVSNVKFMYAMFRETEIFNQDIGGWDVSNVINMSSMFISAKSFDQDISGWDVSNVEYMSFMFANAWYFNQDISGWDVSNVKHMESMFGLALRFDQNLGEWDLSSISLPTYSWQRGGLEDMLGSCGMSTTNYDNTLIGWASKDSIVNNIELGAKYLKYCASELAREYLINEKGWTFKGDAIDADCANTCSCNPNVSPLIPNTAAGLHTAAVKCDDGAFTHYCDNLGRLLLSISSEQADSIPPDSLTVNIVPGIRYYSQGCVGTGGEEDGSCFITNADGATVLCRTWDVKSSEMDASVRYYFDDTDFEIINTGNDSVGLSPLTDMEQLWFYKVTSQGAGHEKPEDLNSSEILLLHNDGTGTPSTTNWVLDSTALSTYYAEYVVSSFSGGGGGGGEKGSSPVCPVIEATISGSTILASPGNADVFVNITGGTGPYNVGLSDGTTVSNYNSGDPISVTAISPTNYLIQSLSDANGCPFTEDFGEASVYFESDDDTPPLAECQDITVDLSSSGTALITAEDIDNGSVDDDSIATLSIDVTMFDCTSGGSDVVTLTVTDASGNFEQCLSIVTINDPLVVCCPAVRDVPNTTTNTKLYEADQQITSDAEVKLGTGNTDIIFEAGNNVQLNAGFTVEQGAVFEAKIGSCGSN